MSKNAAVFLAGICHAFNDLSGHGIAVPSEERINRILPDHSVSLRIDQNELKLTKGYAIVSERVGDALIEEHRGRCTRHEQIGQGGSQGDCGMMRDMKWLDRRFCVLSGRMAVAGRCCHVKEVSSWHPVLLRRSINTLLN